MFIQPNKAFGSPSPFGGVKNAAHAHGAMSGQMNQMMGVMNQALMAQFSALMQQMTTLISQGMASIGSGSPGFGQGASGGGGVGEFLGASGASAASGAADPSAKDAGGGWTNPIGGSYKVTDGFGPREAPTAGASTNHKGVDLAAPLNTPILAAKAGTVSISKDEASGLGKWIEIKHEDGTKSRYGHLNARSVEVGAKVAAGQQIGKMGSTGTSTGSHLHFEVHNAEGVPVDPAKSMKL